jgi:TonB family protein
MLPRIWPAILVLALPAAALAANSPVPVVSLSVVSLSLMGKTDLAQRELHLTKSLTRAAQFANIPHISSRPSCEDVQPPEALATPDPLFSAGSRGKKIKVSFIIGTDGRVHSPLILESAGLVGDRHVLQTVRTWRYRPATCNGVPTETEGKVEFSGR